MPKTGITGSYSNSIFIFIFWLDPATCGILVLRPGIEPAPSAVEVVSPNHWTAREFPIFSFLRNSHSQSFWE